MRPDRCKESAVRAQDSPFLLPARYSGASGRRRFETATLLREDLPVRKQAEKRVQTIAKRYVAAVVPAGVEDRQPDSPRIRCRDRIAAPRTHRYRAASAELAGALAQPAPGRQMGAGRVEYPNLAGARIGDHESAVRQPCGIRDAVELVRPFAVDRPDRQGWLGPYRPLHSRLRRGPLVFDDGDAGAVSYHRARCARGTVVLASATDQEKCHERGGD